MSPTSPALVVALGGELSQTRYPFPLPEFTVCIITQGAFRSTMTRIIQSFSVPDGSIAHARMKAWKESGVNISAIIQALIEEDGAVFTHLEALKTKIRHLRDLTMNRQMTRDEWDEAFMMWQEK